MAANSCLRVHCGLLQACHTRNGMQPRHLTQEPDFQTLDPAPLRTPEHRTHGINISVHKSTGAVCLTSVEEAARSQLHPAAQG